jgi:hypothetical protein
MATQIALTNPLTGGTVVARSQEDADAYLAAGWLDATAELPRPKRGAPKPDLAAGRAALGKSTTPAAKKTSPAKKAAAAPEPKQ